MSTGLKDASYSSGWVILLMFAWAKKIRTSVQGFRNGTEIISLHPWLLEAGSRLAFGKKINEILISEGSRQERRAL